MLSRSGGSWQAIRRLSEATAVNGFVNFFVFDPSPVMHLNDGSTGNAVTYLTGNIVQAEHGFRQLPGCFLYLPLRVVIADTDGDGEASLSIDHPADLYRTQDTMVIPWPGSDRADTASGPSFHKSCRSWSGCAAQSADARCWRSSTKATPSRCTTRSG